MCFCKIRQERTSSLPDLGKVKISFRTLFKSYSISEQFLFVWVFQTHTFAWNILKQVFIFCDSVHATLKDMAPPQEAGGQQL